MEGAMKDNAPHGDEAIMIDDTGVTAPLQSHVHHVIDANRQRKRSQQMADDEMADGQSRFDSDSETEFEKKNVVDFITGRNQKYTFNPNESILDQKVQMVVHYMRQQIGKSGIHKKAMDQEEIQKYVEEVLRNSEVDNKEKIKQEVQFIVDHFRQRRCKKFVENKTSFYSRVQQVLKSEKRELEPGSVLCKCGLKKSFHTQAALKAEANETEWDASRDTETVYPWIFGNLDVPGHYNYLEMPGGSKKYLRLDDIETEPRYIWELLINHWDFVLPNLVISVTGGDITPMKENTVLMRKFQDGIMKCCVKTKAWLITDGMAVGTARELGEIFQEDLRRSQYSELDNHANIPLIGICPWGILADRHQLEGIHVGSDEANYYFSATQKDINMSESVPNALDPYHVAYLFSDDGTSSKYKAEPRIRRSLEEYIKTKTKLQLLGSTVAKTPLVILVLGGDRFTLEKVAHAMKQGTQIPVVIMDGSGPIADMLASIFKALECRIKRSEKPDIGWTDEEEKILLEQMQLYKDSGILCSVKDTVHLKTLMKDRHLIEIFGIEDSDTEDLDRAILKATFQGISDVAVQLFLSIAMDRCDIARDTIFIETRKEELRGHSQMLEESLLMAMKSGRSEFVQLLLDQDYGGELNEFSKFLTIKRLYSLHSENLDLHHLMGKILRSVCKRDVYGEYVLGKEHLLPQVGRIIHHFMGDLYRLLYQEVKFTEVDNHSVPCKMTNTKKEEAVWHLFLWAVLANQADMAELFLYETSCKIGAALVAYKLFIQMSKTAGKLAEVELEADLKANAEHFQDLAMQTLDNLYEFNREEAYASLVALIPFHWGRYVTPLAIADDAAAMRFMGHSCCQTFLNLVWMQYMDLDTPKWKLFPLMAFLPFINISFIVFDKRSLLYGTFKQKYLHDEEVGNPSPLHHNLRKKSHDQSALSVRPVRTHVATNPAYDKDSADEEETNTRSGNVPVKTSGRIQRIAKRMKFAMFCLQNYYTAPINKFIWYMVSYLVFLGLYTHFVLTELTPLSGVSEMSVYEWLVYVWVFCISVEEMAQLFGRPISGPLYDHKLSDLEPHWRHAWHWYERLAFITHFYRIKHWLSDRWNKMDALMLLCFYISVILRFTLTRAHFALVELFFSLTLIIFYLRLLRIGYILKDIGPRIVTIKAMLKDLFQFILILAVFIISFGVAFQAILDSNHPPSWDLLVNIIWRSYWQMYGELFLEDVTEGMGRETVPRNCTYDRELAEANPDTLQVCYTWVAPVLLGIYMLITNILLLNLLIAIFSHSFEVIESEAITIWRYHLYDLVHEYYYQVWLPPPLNILCHLVNILLWLSKWPRIWCYLCAKRFHQRDIQAERGRSSRVFAAGGFWGVAEANKLAEDRLKKDRCYPFYFDAKSQENLYINHFIQQEYMRDEDLEEKAYKRYLRSKKKVKEDEVQQLLREHNSRLQSLTSDLLKLRYSSDYLGSSGFQKVALHVMEKKDSKMLVKQNSSLRMQPHRHNSTPQKDDLEKVKLRLSSIESRIEAVQEGMASMQENLKTVVDLLHQKRSHTHA